MNIRRALFAIFGGSALVFAPTVYAADLNRPVPVKPEFSRPGDVYSWNASFSSSTKFTALPASAKYGGTIATGDLDGDGIPEIFVGAGSGAEPYVNVFTHDGKKIRAFLAADKTFHGGVRVAFGDVNGDGKGEIIVSLGPGASPTIKTFQATGEKIAESFAYAKTFTGGVHIAVADIDHDGNIDIVTSPGPSGGPHVRIWNGDLTNKGMDFFAFDPSMRDGTSIAVLRTSQGPAIIAAPESWSEPLVRRFIFSPTPTLTKEFYAFDSTAKNGLTLAAFDADGNGMDEIIASQNGETTPEIRLLDLFGTTIGTYLVQDAAYRGALSMAQLNDQGPHLLTMPSAPIVMGPTNVEKTIAVIRSEQRLYAYEHGRLARTFLVSTGIRKYPTPVMDVSVLAKIPVKRYAHSYGPGNPDNYDLPNVKYNLQIKGPYFIHYAYWHNNFGHPMSHGCINVGLQNAKWIYDWADVGVPVHVE